MVCWTVDTSDWNYKSADHLVNYVTANTRDGDIILVHETVPTTVQGLPRLLTQLQAKGFTLVTVEDLFWRRGSPPGRRAPLRPEHRGEPVRQRAVF